MAVVNVYVPRMEVHLSTASLRDSPRSTSGSDTGSLQSIASTFGPGACETLCVPFISVVYFTQLSDSPESKSHWPSKPKILGVFLPGARLSDWGIPLSFAIVIIIPLVSYPYQGMGFDSTTFPPLLLSYYGSFFLSLVVSQFSSVGQLCLTLCNPVDCSTPGFPVHYQLLELAQTHVH